MGRDRKAEKRGEHFAPMIRTTMDTPAWRALSSAAQALYPWLRLEWHGPKFNNNGRLQFSVRQAALAMGVTKDTANKAFIDLQRKGFVVVTQEARLGVGGAARSSSYELTEVALVGETEGRKLYRQWEDGKDFAVRKVMANNPSGTNGKTKPCHKNQDDTVINFRTKPKGTS
ncbi:hypothetical protein [Paracoccus sp. N5]|uniref:hypothetical protein n=1 Tax=Paracoccus sp. N5 TaxID=1101189 RepID=UPI00036EF9AF|nr:hypothetical protein [Paracoccus sp. N5]